MLSTALNVHGSRKIGTDARRLSIWAVPGRICSIKRRTFGIIERSERCMRRLVGSAEGPRCSAVDMIDFGIHGQGHAIYESKQFQPLQVSYNNTMLFDRWKIACGSIIPKWKADQ